MTVEIERLGMKGDQKSRESEESIRLLRTEIERISKQLREE